VVFAEHTFTALGKVPSDEGIVVGRPDCFLGRTDHVDAACGRAASWGAADRPQRVQGVWWTPIAPTRRRPAPVLPYISAKSIGMNQVPKKCQNVGVKAFSRDSCRLCN